MAAKSKNLSAKIEFGVGGAGGGGGGDDGDGGAFSRLPLSVDGVSPEREDTFFVSVLLDSSPLKCLDQFQVCLGQDCEVQRRV